MPIDLKKFDLSQEDSALVTKIVNRAVDNGLATTKQKLDVRMDIAAVHNTVPLDLAGLLAAKDRDFNHDVGGIRINLDRNTGALDNFWTPRYAR